MSEQSTPVAEATLSKQENHTVVVYHESCRCYFRPKTLELILIDESEAAAFDNIMSKLSRLMEQLHKAKQDYSDAIEDYGERLKDISNRYQLNQYKNDIAAKEIILENATQALQQELGAFDEQTGYQPVVELIPLEPLKKGAYGRRYSYIKLSDYESFKDKLTIIALDILSDQDVYKKDDDGNITQIDTDALAAKLKKAKSVINDMMNKTKKASVSSDYETTLTDWAEAWNKRDAYHKEGRYIDVSADSQFLRFSSNAAALTSWKPDSGEVRITGEAKSDLTLASGYVDTTIYMPDRVGWQLKFIINDENKEANLGVLRAKIDIGLTGYAGASAQIEGNLQFVTCNNQQMLMGCRTPPSRFEQRQQGVVARTEGEPPKTLEVKADAFAGLRGQGAIGGALQWLKPFDSLVVALPEILRTFGLDTRLVEQDQLAQNQNQNQAAHLGKFTNFASLSLTGELQLGAGLSGEFQIRFERGRFIFHIAGGLCLGPGAKGAVQGEITPAMFNEFAIWAVYQLYGIDFKHLKIIAEQAFMALSYILVMGGVNKYKEYYDDISIEIGEVFGDFKNFVARVSNDFSQTKKESEDRNNFAALINNNPERVYTFTPEGKGAALYLLMGDGAYDRIDYQNQGDGFLPDTHHDRKKAVLAILSSIQTKREWRKVLSRITRDGNAVAYALSSEQAESTVITHQQAAIKKFLQIGFDRDTELAELIDRLELRDFNEVVARLKPKPTFGYPFAPNCSLPYALHCDDNRFYTSLCRFEPVNPYGNHKLEPKN